MAEPKQLANRARNDLAQALESLQSSPDVPERLLEIAAPIAQSMGILHRVEQTGQAEVATCQQALDNVRNALNALQAVGVSNPAVENAMEAVAGSLSKLFALSKTVSDAAAARGVAAAPQAPVQPQPAMAPVAAPQPAQQPVAPQVAQPQAAAPVHAAAPAQPLDHTAMAGTPQMAAPTAQAQDQQAGGGTVMMNDGAGPAVGVKDDHVVGMTGAPPPPSGAQQIDVELGAHSTSNFYKGLSGNDVIDHGGIFVGTYKVPKMNTPVVLRILLPGDLEFVADGIVQWTRDTRSGESEPGFGAKFTRIPPEGRTLVYRYVKNREPMFYDDM